MPDARLGPAGGQAGQENPATYLEIHPTFARDHGGSCSEYPAPRVGDEQGQVGRVITAAMLPSRDVLDVKFHDRGVRLREAAVFAAVSCSMSDQFTNRCVHQEDGCLSKKLRALAWRIVMMSNASTSCLYSAFS
jgi:hypothetical protein